jgi:hypothetical protein
VSKPNKKPNFNADAAIIQEAIRHVMGSVAPQRQQIRQAKRQGKQDYLNLQQRGEAVYGALPGELAAGQQQYLSAVAPIAGQLNADSSTLSGMLGSSIGVAAPGENQAGRNNVATLGVGAQEQLATGQASNLAYDASTARQGAIEKTVFGRNAATDYQNFLSNINQEKRNLAATLPNQIQNEIDTLKEQAFQHNIASRTLGLQESQFQYDKKSAAAMAAYTKAVVNAMLAGHDPNSVKVPDGVTYHPGTGGGDNGMGSAGGGVGGQGAGMNPGSGPLPAGLTADAPPHVAQQWVKWVDLRTAPAIKAAGQQLVQWLSQWVNATTQPDGTITMYAPTYWNLPPEVKSVVESFNKTVQSGGSNA